MICTEGDDVNKCPQITFNSQLKHDMSTQGKTAAHRQVHAHRHTHALPESQSIQARDLFYQFLKDNS